MAFMGDIAGGIAQFDRAIALFDPDRHGRGSLRVGPNPVVVAHSVGALFLWMSGYPDTAERRAAASIALAERLGHPYSLAYAVFHAAMLDLWRAGSTRPASRPGGSSRSPASSSTPSGTRAA